MLPTAASCLGALPSPVCPVHAAALAPGHKVSTLSGFQSVRQGGMVTALSLT